RACPCRTSATPRAASTDKDRPHTPWYNSDALCRAILVRATLGLVGSTRREGGWNPPYTYGQQH
ncbi:MAG: hypothetical protein KAV82_06790, partial [Phycisphaerae bacterium]|nr:hypothetical protein [Phycisphaerae bacterium]